MKTKQIKNAILNRTGINVDIIKGEGYWYFVFDGWEKLYSTSVYVYALNHLSVDQWVNEFLIVLKDKPCFFMAEQP